ncbi:MAG: cation diffusion facilitator family transporter [Leptospirillia bacterium]
MKCTHNHDHHDNDGFFSPSRPSSILRLLLLSGLLLLALALPEIVAGVLSKSRGLLGDGLHNLLDVVGILPLLFGLWIVRRPPSERFPYGLGKAETLTALIVVLLVFLSALTTLALSIRGLLHPLPVTLPRLAMAMALASAVTNILVGLLQVWGGKGSDDPALTTSGHHALTDAGLALGVLAGIAAAPLGYPRVDAVAGILLGMVLMRSTLPQSRTLLYRLMDGIDPKILRTIREVAATTPGVLAIEEVRARWVGREIHADMTLRIDQSQNTRAAHELSEEVHHRLLHKVEKLSQVLIHLHPSGEDLRPRGPHRHDGLPLHSHASQGLSLT